MCEPQRGVHSPSDPCFGNAMKAFKILFRLIFASQTFIHFLEQDLEYSFGGVGFQDSNLCIMQGCHSFQVLVDEEVVKSSFHYIEVNPTSFGPFHSLRKATEFKL